MDYTAFVKKLTLPPNFQAPTEFISEDLVAKSLTRLDLHADMDAVNSSLELIRKTRGGSWPSEAVSEAFDLLDLAWHEREFRDGGSFAYVVHDASGTYVGCFYLYPMGVRTTLTDELLSYDIDASWWVSAEAYKHGYYEKLYQALQMWLASGFPGQNIYYSNKEIPFV
jgi:hypothetical protein